MTAADRQFASGAGASFGRAGETRCPPVQFGEERRLTTGSRFGSAAADQAWLPRRSGENSGKGYVSLSLAAPEFGPRKLYANLGRAAGRSDNHPFAII